VSSSSNKGPEEKLFPAIPSRVAFLGFKKAPRKKDRTEMPDNTVRKQDTRFKPGQSGNPAGRPKGSRNKVSEKLLEALASDFDAHGQDVIEKVRAERPADYLKIVASLGSQADGD
jgi:Family of unknown function (DUF5681)